MPKTSFIYCTVLCPKVSGTRGLHGAPFSPPRIAKHIIIKSKNREWVTATRNVLYAPPSIIGKQPALTFRASLSCLRTCRPALSAHLPAHRRSLCPAPQAGPSMFDTCPCAPPQKKEKSTQKAICWWRPWEANILVCPCSTIFHGALTLLL